MALEPAPFGNLVRHPATLNGVSVFDADIRVLQGELAYLLTAILGRMEAFGGFLDQF
jgi:hypothetical protein